jgi:hypothetical protein
LAGPAIPLRRAGGIIFTNYFYYARLDLAGLHTLVPCDDNRILMIDRGALLLNYRGLNATTQGRLKIGVVVEGPRGPLWVHSLLELLGNVPWFDVHLFVAGSRDPQTSATSSGLAGRLYTWSRGKADPFGEADLHLEEDEPVLNNALANPLPESVRDAIRARKLDLLCWIPDEIIPEGPCSDLAQFGVVTIRLGQAFTKPPYWQEVIDRQLLSRAVILWHVASFEKARVLRTAEIATKQGWFFTRNAEECLDAICRMLGTVALELLSDGPSWVARQLAILENNCPVACQRKYPSNLAAGGFIARQAWRSLGLRAKVRGRRPGWFVALRRDPERHYARSDRFSPSALEEIPAPAGSEMADPFLATDGNKTWLFFEEVPAGAAKGRLSCMEMGVDQVGFPEPTVVMEADYHLSYPCVVSDRREFFLVPESCKTRTIQLFRATRFPFEWGLETILMEDFAAVDTTPFFLDGRWYFFTTTAEPFMETFLFWAESLSGRWHLHPKSPISSSVRSSRSAGHLFYKNGRLLRPTQDCSVRYGYGIAIREITRLTSTEFEERSVDFIAPSWRRGLLGTHTLNSCGPFEVVDGLR